MEVNRVTKVVSLVKMAEHVPSISSLLNLHNYCQRSDCDVSLYVYHEQINFLNYNKVQNMAIVHECIHPMQYHKITVLPTSFRKACFACHFTQKKYICKLLSCFNAKPFVVATCAQIVCV